MPRRGLSTGSVSALQSPYWSEAEAQEVLDLWRRSGTSLSAFARDVGLCRNRLARWRDRLGETHQDPLPMFHRVRVVDRPGERAAESGGVEIHVPGGRRIAVHRGFDASVLVEVVRLLESLAC